MSGYGSMGSEGQQGMGQMKDDLSQKTGEVIDQAREQTGQAIDKVRGSAFQAIDQQKHRAADSLGSVAQALRQTGDSLHSSEQGALGQYASRAADAVEQFSSQLHDKSVEELLDGAQQFARREPELFLGGAVLLGLLASRFLKASSRQSQMRNQDFDQYGYRGQYDRGYSQGQYGRSSMGPGGYDRGAWGGEGIDYRSAGTGGYRTTVSGRTGSGSYGDLSAEERNYEEMSPRTTPDDLSLGQEHGTRSFEQRRSGASNMGRGNTGHDLNAGWQSGESDEDETPGFGAGSSQA